VTVPALPGSVAVDVPRPLVIACGALVAELRAVLSANSLSAQVDVRYLPANLHNRPERIVPAIRELVAAESCGDQSDRPVVLGYADCGTGGMLDSYLAEHPNTVRLPGDHCYGFFSGSDVFAALHEAEPGTFFLTDFLAKHFDALVWQGLGLDRHPQLRDAYFGNYTRVVLVSQTVDPALVEVAREAAERLSLRFEHHHVGLAPFTTAVTAAVAVAVTVGRAA
jgi:Protein of unknown function (DUF1638)